MTTHQHQDSIHKLSWRGDSPDVTGCDTFREWFSGSTVTDSRNMPLVQFHATVGKFKKFKITAKDIGIHFGTLEQSQFRAQIKREENPTVECRIIAAYLRVTNPLRLQDLYQWKPFDLYTALKELPEFSEQLSIPLSTRCLNYRSFYRDLITAAGYDGIVYSNRIEVPGSVERKELMMQKEKAAWQLPEGRTELTVKEKELAKGRARAAQDEYDAYISQTARDSWVLSSPDQILSCLSLDPKAA